jgi:hypothetical protein
MDAVHRPGLLFKTMPNAKAQITRSLSRLISLPLSIARDAASMKNFQFGAVKPHPSGDGTVGQYALHIQCPWRLLGREGIVTGSYDYYEPVDADKEVDLNDRQAGNLQRKRLGDLLRKYDASTRSWVNDTGHLVVEAVSADDCGGFELMLSGDFRLQIVPCGTRGEDWRFFAPGIEEHHLVIEGGRISEAPEMLFDGSSEG